jgi:hypothetical protein
MIHWQISSNPNNNYGVSTCATNKGVLIQLTEGVEQARIRLNKEEVEHLIYLLQLAEKTVYEN